MSALDDTGTVAAPACPFCESWAVTVSLDDVPWPLAGLLVEQAIAEHVDEHLWTALDGTPGGERPRPVTSTATLGPGGLEALGGDV